MKYIYNNEFEIIDTQDKAYILGLIYSDGFITYNKDKCNYFSAIKLHIQDKELLINIIKKFKFFSYSEKDNYCIIRCNKRKFCEDLIKNGVLPNKSTINKNLLRFPKIKYELYSHFIRGYFDGDGSVYYIKTNSKNSKGFTFTSNNYFFIKKLQEILWSENIQMKLYFNRGGSSVIRGTKIVFNSLCFSIKVQNKKTIKIASKYLYKNANFYINRKYVIFNTWFENEKYKCPKCQSLKTSWQIKNIYLKCNNCKKYSKIVCPII